MAKGKPQSWSTQQWVEDPYDAEAPRAAPAMGPLVVVLVVVALVAGVLGGALAGYLFGSRAPSGGGGNEVTFHLNAILPKFTGVGGSIDGLDNPALVVAPGDRVTIIVTNIDTMEHDFFIETYNKHIAGLVTQGSTGQVTFTADREGTFVYYCTIPGHRQAGMVGELIVGTPSQHGPGPAKEVDVANIARNPADVPPPLTRVPTTVHIYLQAREVVAEIEPGTTFTYWTFNGTVPGPFFRVLLNDTVVVHFSNAATSTMSHSVDFHAVTGPGGGAVATQTAPGATTSFSFKAIMPGLYVYHCASPHIPTHISAGMYGLILVEPAGGLPPVDKEYYVMQGDIYTMWAARTAGHQEFDGERMASEDPTYVVFNGKIGSLTGSRALTGAVGETIRIYFGVGGPNLVSSWHVIGEMFDTVWNLGDVLSPPLQSVQTVLVPPGGAAIADIRLDYPGDYILVDHSLTRTIDKGSLGILTVTGPADDTIFKR